jgi:hypothetical protein
MAGVLSGPAWGGQRDRRPRKGISRMLQINSKLIVDVRASNGNDIHYYLRKGSDVVGLEADPVIYASLKQRFATEIADGTVILLNRVAA